MPNIFKQVFDFFKHLITRPGMSDFLHKYEQLAISIVTQTLAEAPGKSFHDVADIAWQKVQSITGQEKGTWITILINLAFEAIKAGEQSPTPASTSTLA